jgi:2-polyprenyl-3-methyl-5-hydroxy-6-metoxy-1,4-benzoquinol methylase
MIQATAFHAGVRVSRDDIYDARDSCPICRSRQPRRVVFTIQRDPDIEMLMCLSCGASSASQMPRPELLERYYAQYYRPGTSQYTLNDPTRFARHLLPFLRDLVAASSLRILDFGGGDGSLAFAIARELQNQAGGLVSIAIDIVDKIVPRHPDLPNLTVQGHRELGDVEGYFDLILASAILEHIPDAYSAIRRLTGAASARGLLYARTPFVLPMARFFPVDMTYPAHVHDMGSSFWNKFIQTFGLRARTLASRPSLVETTIAENPIRSCVAHALKLPALAELILFGRNRTPWWKLVGGWEIVLQFE